MKKLKKTKNFHFRKKITVPKKTESRTLWGKQFPEKKSRSAEKNWKGGPFGLPGYGMVRGGKTGKTFLVQFARPIVQFGAIIFCRTF